MTETVKKPSLFLFLSESFRWIIEGVITLWFCISYTLQQKGDGHPVLVIPGFLGNDLNMLLMRFFLKRLNYLPCKWGLGWNMGDRKNIEPLAKKLEFLHQKHQQKISIIGWSLGGIFARELAKQYPDLVHQVITMGTPFEGIDKPSRAMWFYNLINGNDRSDEDLAWVKTIPQPPPVRTASIYSKKDGIVPWQYCLASVEDTLHQNIEVRSSHVGMPYNKSILKIIEYLLGQ